MPARLQLYADDDATPISGTISTGDVDAGTTFTAPTWHLFNDKDSVFGDTTPAEGLVARAKVNDGVELHESGYPVLDQRWVGIQVVGFDNAGDSTFAIDNTAVIPIGAGAAAVLPKIPKGCAIYIEVSFSPIASADTESDTVVLEFSVGEASVVLPLRLGTVSGGGVVPDWMDASLRRFTRTGILGASGTADVVVPNRSFVAAGLPHTVAKETITFDQNALDGALATGQSYRARLSQPISGGAITVTKSNKGTSPTKPAVPSNEINRGTVRVAYQSGTSVINTSDLDETDVIIGERLVTAGSGLNAVVWLGNSIASTDLGPFADQSLLVALSDDDTNYVWLAAEGGVSANTTGIASSLGAQLLAIVVTASGAITSIEDARTFAGHAIYDYLLVLSKSGDITATANDFAWGVAPFDAVIMFVSAELGQLGASASGSTKVNVLTRAIGADMSGSGTTIFTSSGTDDQRPSIAYNAAVLRSETSGHEVVTVTKGTRISASIAAVFGTITSNPKDLIVTVALRRLR